CPDFSCPPTSNPPTTRVQRAWNHASLRARRAIKKNETQRHRAIVSGYRHAGGEAGSRGRMGGADSSRRQVQCSLTQNLDIALAGLPKLDDLHGDHFVGEVAWAFNSRTNGFECDAHETRGLRIEVLVA